MTNSILPIPCVNVALINSHREVLLTRRSEKVRAPGYWCLPGGHVDPGEGWSKAALREVQEEVGIILPSLELIGVYSDPALCVTEGVLETGNFGQYLCAAFRAYVKDPKVVPNDEVDDWDWFSIDNLPDPILKSHPVRVMDSLIFDGEIFVK